MRARWTTGSRAGVGDFDDYWRFHLSREQQRDHLVRYALDILTMAA